MLLTEEEAKTKWCPFARYSNGGLDGASNRWTGALAAEAHARVNPDPCRCIASACMAWRWEKRRERVETEPELLCVSPVAISNHNAYRDAPPTHGLCGLAGKAVP